MYTQHTLILTHYVFTCEDQQKTQSSSSVYNFKECLNIKKKYYNRALLTKPELSYWERNPNFLQKIHLI